MLGNLLNWAQDKSTLDEGWTWSWSWACAWLGESSREWKHVICSKWILSHNKLFWPSTLFSQLVSISYHKEPHKTVKNDDRPLISRTQILPLLTPLSLFPSPDCRWRYDFDLCVVSWRIYRYRHCLHHPPIVSCTADRVLCHDSDHGRQNSSFTEQGENARLLAS